MGLVSGVYVVETSAHSLTLSATDSHGRWTEETVACRQEGHRLFYPTFFRFPNTVAQRVCIRVPSRNASNRRVCFTSNDTGNKT